MFYKRGDRFENVSSMFSGHKYRLTGSAYIRLTDEETWESWNDENCKVEDPSRITQEELAWA